MKKQFVIIGIVSVLVCISLSGYTNNPLDTKKNKFVGKWETDNSYALKDLGKTITFYSDGTACLRNLESYREIKDGKLIVDIMKAGTEFYYSFQFSNYDRTLEITNDILGITYIYTKQ